MMNVHAVYVVCKDADFVRYAKDEYARWEQGANMTLKEYMALACTKYQTLIMKGQWEAPSPEQEQIMALTAAVSLLKSRTGRTTGGKVLPSKPREQRNTRTGRKLGRMWHPRQVNPTRRKSRTRPTSGELATDSPSGPCTILTRSQTCASTTQSMLSSKPLQKQAPANLATQQPKTSSLTQLWLPSRIQSRRAKTLEEVARLMPGSGQWLSGY
jgi:hypothetical protein